MNRIQRIKYAISRRKRVEIPLTLSEASVYNEFLESGGTNIEIGEALGISPRTVGKHLEAIFLIFRVQTRAALIAKFHAG